MRGISDDEQIVEDRHDKNNKDEGPQDETEEEDDEPGEEEDEEENPCVGIQDEVEELQKEKLEALIAEFQKSVRFTESGSC